MRTFLVATLLALAGCGTGPDTVSDDAPEPDGGDGDAPSDEDGGVELDAGSPDARTGLVEGADCDVLGDECADGLTCRIVDAWGGGRCGVLGELAAGEACSAPFTAMTSPCGAAMACYNEPNSACYVLCDVDDPGSRCAVGQGCSVVIPDTTIGLCD